MKKTTKKRYSLQWNMVSMVLLCWVLPVIIIVAGTGITLLGMTEQQVKKEILVSAETASDIAAGRMNEAVASCRNASYSPTLRDAWNNYQLDGNATALRTAYNRFLDQQYRHDNKFTCVFITMTDEPEKSFSRLTTAGAPMSTQRQYYDNVQADVLDISKTLGRKIAFFQKDGHCYLVRNLTDNSLNRFAVMVCELNTSSLLGELGSIVYATDVTVWLNGCPVVLSGEMQALPQTEKNAVLLQETVGHSFLLQQARTGADYSMTYSAVISPAALRTQRSSIVLILVFVCVLFIPLTMIVLSFFRRRVTRPLDAMAEVAEKISKGEFGAKVPQTVMGSAEFGRLGDNFNRMSDILLNQFDKIYKEKLALRDAKIMALQSQINPHFLNNTLEIINWEARMAGNIKVCNMLENLFIMLNAAMNRGNRPLVFLSEEMRYADAYLYIISVRLGKRLTVNKEIDSSVLDRPVPRLILQPIIENAVEHGIDPVKGGHIDVRAYPQGRWLILEVENDGTATDEDLERIRALLQTESPSPTEKSTSLGIRNVHQRLQIIYGPECGLEICVKPNGNTLFSMKIDMRQDQQYFTM